MNISSRPFRIHNILPHFLGPVAVLLVFLLSACDSGQAVAPVEPPSPGFTLSASLLELSAGQTAQLSVLQRSGAVQTVLQQGVTWTSADPAVASVNGSGVVTGTKPGETTVTAATRAGASYARVRVKNRGSAVMLSPKTLTLSGGETAQLSVSVVNNGGKAVPNPTVTWTSLDPSIIEVDGSGRITAIGAGKGRVEVLAAHGGDTATVTVAGTVASVAGVNVTPTSATLPAGSQAQLVATAVDSRGMPMQGATFAWKSSDAAIATVDSKGLVKTLKEGQAAITVTASIATGSTGTTIGGVSANMMGSGGVSATVGVTVRGDAPPTAPVASIAISPKSDTLDAIGDTIRMSATVRDAQGTELPGVSVVWTTLNPEFVSVEPNGKLIAKAAGLALIIGTAGSHADTASIVVRQVVSSLALTPNSATVEVGRALAFAVVAYDSRGNRVPNQTASWSSGSPAIATLDAAGVATGVSVGATQVSAKIGSSVATAPLNVVTASGSEPRPGSSAPSPAELPRRYVDTSMPQGIRDTIRVAANGDLQDAINRAAAMPSAVVLLPPGAVYRGNFRLPSRTGAGWVVVRTDTPLPNEGTRVSPASAARFARLESPDNGRVIETQPQARRYRLVGIEVAYAAAVTSGTALIEFGGSRGEQTSLANTPTELVVDRSYVHGREDLGIRRCIALNSAWSAVIDSYLAECHISGFDSQAIAGWNGPGPFKIVNNFLEGAGENIIFGGADAASAEMIPADIEIRRNHLYKNPEWYTSGRWSVKNLFELKTAVRVLVEGNVMENNWKDGQDGMGVLIKSVNQSGGFGDFSRATDITFRYNIIRNSVGGLNLSASPSDPVAEPLSRVYIGHNRWENGGYASGFDGSARAFLLQNEIQGLTLEHNTALGNYKNQIIVETDGGADVRIIGNVVDRSQYGVSNSDALDGLGVVNFSGNVITDATWNNSLPAGNCVVAAISPIPPACSGAGEDEAALRAATAGVVVR